jgi:gas vesicle protein
MNRDFDEGSFDAGSFMVGLLAGAMIGAITVLLTAPKPGVEMRGMIGEKTSELKDKALTAAEQTREKAKGTFEAAKDKAQTTLQKSKRQLREENEILEDIHTPDYPL